VSNLSAVSRAPGRLDILGFMEEGVFGHWWWDNGWKQDVLASTPLVYIANEIQPGVSAVSWGPDRLDAFALVHVSHGLLHWWWDNGWSGPEFLGGNLTSGPSAVSWGPGRLDVLGVDAGTSELVHWWWDNGWGGPELRGGKLGGGVSAVSWGPGRLDVFGIDATTRQLVHGQRFHLHRLQRYLLRQHDIAGDEIALRSEAPLCDNLTAGVEFVDVHDFAMPEAIADASVATGHIKIMPVGPPDHGLLRA
jgi:hypothetical protein